MNRAQIIQEVANVLTHKKDAEEAVRKTFDVMLEALRQGDKVVISNFGTFRISMKKAHQGRNPKTGTAVTVPPKKSIRFRMSKQVAV